MSAYLLPFFARLPLVIALCCGLFVQTLTGTARAQETIDYDTWSVPQLEQELQEKTLGGPIALLATGGGLVVGSAALALVGVLIASGCGLARAYDESSSDDYDYYSSSSQDQQGSCWPRGLMLTAGTVALVGGGLATGGGVWLGSRIGQRRSIRAAIERKQSAPPGSYPYAPPPPGGYPSQRAAVEWRVGLAPARGGPSLGLSVSF